MIYKEALAGPKRFLQVIYVRPAFNAKTEDIRSQSPTRAGHHSVGHPFPHQLGL